jgi:hypothetical protein
VVGREVTAATYLRTAAATIEGQTGLPAAVAAAFADGVSADGEATLPTD